MELREYAKRILFAKTLEQKLEQVDQITDFHPGSAILTPATPTRPANLSFAAGDSAKVPIPKLSSPGDDRERGVMLHFLANHELLATELMALVLLKFPNAPKSFRQGVLHTLKEEQQHTGMYQRRMQELNIDFGDLPVSSYFWRVVAPMESPLDYVTRLSMTFEQANLDYTQHYARLFDTLGDSKTALILNRIYRDEIGHVAYGVKWFRRWKNPEQNDWQAFRRQLAFPLSPARAKGLSFNTEGRKRAGLDEEFIKELHVYSQSKGRTPSVYLFNPLAEEWIAHGKKFHPKRHQAALAEDLSNLPQFLCRKDDVVLVPRRPSIKFLNLCQARGFELPQFEELQQGQLSSASKLKVRKIRALKPWARSPDSLKVLGPLLTCLTEGAAGKNEFWTSRMAKAYSKAWSAELLQKFLQQNGSALGDLISPEIVVGRVADSPSAVWDWIDCLRSEGFDRMVAKAPYGCSGQNMIRLWDPQLSSSQRKWIEKIIATQKAVIIEPWLKRVMDFSVQLEMSDKGLKIFGYTGLINDHRGQFQASLAGRGWASDLPQSLRPRLPVTKLYSRQPVFPYNLLLPELEKQLENLGFRGPIGIDAFVYKHPKVKQFRLKPIVEINPRYTMGRLTLELMRHVSPGRMGRLHIVTRQQINQDGFDGFTDYAQELKFRVPFQREGSPVAKISTGTLCLNDPELAVETLALFTVSGAQSQDS